MPLLLPLADEPGREPVLVDPDGGTPSIWWKSSSTTMSTGLGATFGGSSQSGTFFVSTLDSGSFCSHRVTFVMLFCSCSGVTSSKASSSGLENTRCQIDDKQLRVNSQVTGLTQSIKKMGHSRHLFLYFPLIYFNVQLVDKILPMLGFKPRNYGVGCDCSTN